jgi:hypothetical protein
MRFGIDDGAKHPLGSKDNTAAIERVIADTINETARVDPDALASRIVAALAEAAYRIIPATTAIDFPPGRPLADAC